jgi:CRP-like cAMP-binding protein
MAASDDSGALACADGGADDIFGDLKPEQRAQLERRVIVADYPPGHIFYTPGEQGDRLLIVRRGRVRLYKLSPEGRALTLFVLEPQAVFGEMALVDRQHDSFAEAVTECSIGTLARSTLRDILRDNPAVTLRFMDVMSERLRAMERKLADIAFKSVPQRLASVLLNLADCRADRPSGGAPPVVVRYTHQQLAEMIGSYRETVTKAVGEFREDGLIRVEEDAIYLTDVLRLRELAGR